MRLRVAGADELRHTADAMYFRVPERCRGRCLQWLRRGEPSGGLGGLCVGIFGARPKQLSAVLKARSSGPCRDWRCAAMCSVQLQKQQRLGNAKVC